jgi:hypothetical protein
MRDGNGNPKVVPKKSASTTSLTFTQKLRKALSFSAEIAGLLLLIAFLKISFVRKKSVLKIGPEFCDGV